MRCLREDLHLQLPPASTPLDQVDHPLLAKAGEQFADPDTVPVSTGPMSIWTGG
jgi:hypothetical protein